MKSKIHLFKYTIAAALLVTMVFVALSGRNVYAAPDPGTPTDSCFGNKDDACVPVCPTDQPKCNANDTTVFQNCQSVAKSAKPTCEASNNLFTTYVNPLVKFLTYMVGLAVVIGIIVGGIQYASSGGDPQKAANGKKHIKNAIFGLLLYVTLFAILQFLIPGGVLK